MFRDDEDMRTLFYKLMHETIAVARAAGVELPPDLSADIDRSVAAFPPSMKASMANDLEAGNRLEFDWLAGKVIGLRRKYGVATPTQEVIYAILRPYRMGRATQGVPILCDDEPRLRPNSELINGTEPEAHTRPADDVLRPFRWSADLHLY